MRTPTKSSTGNAGARVAILVTDGFEQVELTEPRAALKKAGYQTDIVSPNGSTVKAMIHDQPGKILAVDVPLSRAKASDYDALLLPGGVMNPDSLRTEPAAVSFVKAFFEAGKPVGAICHGPIMLIEAGVLPGRRLTSFPSIQTDVRNAGGTWINKTVVVDRNLVTSRKLADIPSFNRNSYDAGIRITRRMAEEDPRYFLPRQFENPLNAQDHEHTTGVEILAQVPERIGAFVNGYGTGGTLAGVSRALRKRYPEVKVFAMEPAEAAVLNGEAPCCHQIEGIADGFVPDLLKGVPLDGAIKVSSAEAMRMTQRLAKEFGLLVGASSGANVVASIKIAAQLGGTPAIATLLCDRAERYFSTELFRAENSCPAAPRGPMGQAGREDPR
jgi:PfpI family intracellular protease